MVETLDAGPRTGATRRDLLKGAVAVGVGAAVYSTPVVSVMPAYAAGALASFSSESGTVCIWFSPNQNSMIGNWHRDIGGDDENNCGSNPPCMTVSYTVGGTPRSITFSGNPNNSSGGATGGGQGAPDGTPNPAHFGGGAAIALSDNTCEVVVVGVVCQPQNMDNCNNTNANTAPNSWSAGSSTTPINQAAAPNGNVGNGIFLGGQTVYYHTGRTGSGQDSRCKWGFLFNIRCA